MKKLTMISLTTLLVGCSTAPDIEQQIDELYGKMSQEERIAQLKSMYMDDLFDEQGKLDEAKCKELIPNGIGHFSQFCMQQPRDPNELRDRAAAVQDWLIKNTPNGIPALLHEEVLSGVNTLGSTIYPQQIGQACSFNPELAALKTIQTSTAMRKMGGVLALSPMVDVCRIPSFNRLEESYGEDGYLSAVMGVAFVKGLQQGDLKKGVGACSKHYLGYGGGGDAEEKEMMEEILLPHEAMIRLAGSKVVMPGYHAVHGTKCVANSEILQDILRDYIGFDGMVVSDYTAIDQLPDLDDVVKKAAAAINGGNDVDFPHGANYQHLQEAIDQGLVKPEVLERAVKDVLRHKFRAGLFDKDAYLYSKENIKLDTPEERQTAYDIATQSIVLLENNGVLPLKPNTQNPRPTILVTGPNANSIWAMCGDYTYPAMSYFWKKMEDVANRDKPHIIKLLEGMNGRKPEGVNILYSRGCDWTEDIETKYSELGDERAWEFGSEALRKFDLVRWNLYAKKIEQAMRTAICWGISTNQDLMALPDVLTKFPEAANYVNWADKLYYKKIAKGSQKNRKSDIVWLNEKYKIDDANLTAGWSSVNWGSNMIKRTTTYVTAKAEYSNVVKTTDKESGTITYQLNNDKNSDKFLEVITVNDGEPTGITRKDVYAASDYFTRLYRGYSGGALTGNGVVPYLLAINTETISASTVLNNDGYKILDAIMEKGTNVEIATIEKEYK